MATTSFTVISVNGAAFGCGSNANGNLGLGDYEDRNTFAQINLPCKVLSFSSGGEHTVIVTEDGSLWSFGIYRTIRTSYLKPHHTDIPIIFNPDR
jgi:alpha-tubulin suppressor-like RCC1 family protein